MKNLMILTLLILATSCKTTKDMEAKNQVIKIDNKTKPSGGITERIHDPIIIKAKIARNDAKNKASVQILGSNISENTNLYYTDGRVDTEVATLPLTTLSDVTYTAGAGIDGKVLTYVHGSTEWQAVTPATAPVSSVNTQTGAVVLDTADVAENTNLYFTNGRVDTEVATLPLTTLSDVTYTAGAGIDGKVLTYVHASSEWQAVTASGGGGSAPTVTAQNTTTSLSAPGAGEIEQTYTVNSASAVVLTLVSAATTGAGFKYQVKRLGGGTVTAQPAGSEYIDHAGQASFAVGAQYDSITLQSDGTNWILI